MNNSLFSSLFVYAVFICIVGFFGVLFTSMFKNFKWPFVSRKAYNILTKICEGRLNRIERHRKEQRGILNQYVECEKKIRELEEELFKLQQENRDLREDIEICRIAEEDLSGWNASYQKELQILFKSFLDKKLLNIYLKEGSEKMPSLKTYLQSKKMINSYTLTWGD